MAPASPAKKPHRLALSAAAVTAIAAAAAGIGYAVANTFMYGDTPGQNPPTNTDWSVPAC
ncbi:hypothetical protein [Streptomyces sp. NRRL S-244]|uniref:hypothetical protein n=1 Tax=Streptomyces sp. NRRL S-244 TaxID=1463897 RepID=UPI0004BE804E|nr:hypothetical protein [Streptomyces sp. NRRL S-244]